MALEAAADDVGVDEGLCAGGVDVAGEEEEGGDALGGLLRHHEAGAGAVAPADDGGLCDAEGVHHGAGVGGHQPCSEKGWSSIVLRP